MISRLSQLKTGTANLTVICIARTFWLNRGIYAVTEVGISEETNVSAGLGWRYISTGVTIPEMVSGTKKITVVPTEPQVDVVYGDTLINAVQKVEFYAVRNNASNDTESDMSSIKNKILIR